MKFEETSMIQGFKLSAKAFGMLLDERDVSIICQTILLGTSDFLRIVKNKNAGAAVVFDNAKGEMILAAVVKYNDNDTGEGSGNWNYFFTFDKKDIEGMTTYSVNSTQLQSAFNDRAFESYNASFPTTIVLSQYAVLFASLLSEFLEANASDSEEFTVEHEGFFVATSAVEDGVVVKSMIPDGALKRLIKDDAATEKAA